MIILVIDANVLFSALIKNSLTAKLIFDDELKLYSPEFIIEEFFKYKKIILEKTSRTENEFIQIMHLLKETIKIIPQAEYSNYMQDAKKISPDEKDTLYFALALKLKCDIWSNDKKLKTQNIIRIYSTDDLLNKIKYN